MHVLLPSIYIAVIEGHKGTDAKEKAFEEIYDKLNLVSIDFNKAAKAAQKIYDAAENVDIEDRSPKMSQAAKDLLANMEQAEEMNSDLSFMIKFKKLKGSGHALNLSNAQSSQQSAAKLLT